MEPQSTPNTQMGDCRDRLDALSRQIIGCALMVMRTPGTGFLEKVHQNALVHALRKAGITVAQQHRMVVRYKDVVVGGVVIGDYTVDMLVETIVPVALKVTKVPDDIHRAQCLNDLRATIENHGPAPATRFRQASPRDPANGPGPLKQSADFACSACFAVPFPRDSDPADNPPPSWPRRTNLHNPTAIPARRLTALMIACSAASSTPRVETGYSKLTHHPVERKSWMV
ncbi:MAG TPA: GxxExxY protein, partial [Rhodopila sp.]|uniref:GxxExxY protein n=1 Tax=Rhodopila sp. TaxID=2480087 RepID=UPI002CD81DD2